MTVAFSEHFEAALVEPMGESYGSYLIRHLERHANGLTSWLSTIGDLLMAGGLAAGVLSRRRHVAAFGLSLGFGVAAVAHLFQPGTLGDELSAIFLHPIWALRAERERIERTFA